MGWLAGATMTVRIVGADGTLARLADVPATRPWAMSLVGLAGGGFAIVWAEESHMPASQTDTSESIRFRLYDDDGNLKQDTTTVTGSGTVTGGTLYWSISNLTATATPDGGFAVGWGGRPYIVAPYWAYLRRYDHDGQPVGTDFMSTPSEYTGHVAALPDGTTVLASTISEYGGGITLRRFDATGALISGPTLVQATQTDNLLVLRYDITALPDGTLALAWAAAPYGQVPTTVQTQALSAGGAPLSNAVTMQHNQPQVDAFSVVPKANGYSVLLQSIIGYPRGSFDRLGEIQLTGAGTSAYQVLREASITSVSDITGATTGPAVPGYAVAPNGGDHLLSAYERAISGGAQVVLEGH